MNQRDKGKGDALMEISVDLDYEAFVNDMARGLWSSGHPSSFPNFQPGTPLFLLLNTVNTGYGVRSYEFTYQLGL